MLDRDRLLTPSQALLVGLEAARGLDYAHRRGFVHRDIKPANLLFDDDAGLRIADFGLARALAEAAWTEPAGVVLGTARYASPEQARGLAVDGKSDVYSLALVLVEAVTGQVPFAADTTVATLMNRIDKLLPVGGRARAAGAGARASRSSRPRRALHRRPSWAAPSSRPPSACPARRPCRSWRPRRPPARPTPSARRSAPRPRPRAGPRPAPASPAPSAPAGAVATASTPGTGQLDVRAAGAADGCRRGGAAVTPAAGSNGRNGSAATVTAGRATHRRAAGRLRRGPRAEAQPQAARPRHRGRPAGHRRRGRGGGRLPAGVGHDLSRPAARRRRDRQGPEHRLAVRLAGRGAHRPQRHLPHRRRLPAGADRRAASSAATPSCSTCPRARSRRSSPTSSARTRRRPRPC